MIPNVILYRSLLKISNVKPIKIYKVMKKNKANENNYHFIDLWSCVKSAILDMHLRVNVNTYACILKHLYNAHALIT